jgi:hypothetical protein
MLEVHPIYATSHKILGKKSDLRGGIHFKGFPATVGDVD